MRETFSELEDTRQQAQVRHELYEIIAMTIAAVIGNSDGWDEIEDFCLGKEDWLREHMGLKLNVNHLKEKNLSVSFADSSPYEGEPRG